VFFAAIGLDNCPHSERSNVHKPVASEIGVARKNLPFVVGINVRSADERYWINGVVLAGNYADAFSCMACVGEMEAVVIDRRETYYGYVVSTGRSVVVKHIAKAACCSLKWEWGVGIGVAVEHEAPVCRTDHAIAYRTRTGFQLAGEELVERFVV
jgi:hypothetical protein